MSFNSNKSYIIEKASNMFSTIYNYFSKPKPYNYSHNQNDAFFKKQMIHIRKVEKNFQSVVKQLEKLYNTQEKV